jgi:putative ABC transport system permease protein
LSIALNGFQQLASVAGACLGLAWTNLAARKIRTLVAGMGVTFAIFLLFLQFGFLDATRRAATQVYDFFDFDLALVSADYQYFNAAPSFDRIRQIQMQAVPAVVDTFNLNIRTTRWVDPETLLRSSLMLIGVDDKPAFIRDPAIRDGLALLGDDDTVIADAYAHADYGDTSVGAKARINDREVRVAARFAFGPFFYAEGSAIARNDSFSRLARRDRRQTSVGLVRIGDDQDADAVKAAIAELLPDDVVILTRQELIRQEQDYFIAVKPVGIMFDVGAITAFVLGAVTLFQVLSTEITNRLKEYATIKAIGFGARFVYGLGIAQTAMLVLLGFVPAAVISLIVFDRVRAASHLPVQMGGPLIEQVLALSLAMGAASGLITLYRVKRADPAELF